MPDFEDFDNINQLNYTNFHEDSLENELLPP